MDMLSNPPRLDIDDDSWRIYSRTLLEPPQYISESACLKDCAITEGCNIYGTVEHSVLSAGITVGKNSVIRDSVIMPHVKIGDNVTIEKAIIGSGATIGDGVKIGVNENENNPYLSNLCTNGISLLQGNVIIDSNVEIYKGSMVENDIVSENILFEKTSDSKTPEAVGTVKGGA